MICINNNHHIHPTNKVLNLDSCGQRSAVHPMNKNNHERTHAIEVVYYKSSLSAAIPLFTLEERRMFGTGTGSAGTTG